MWNVVLADLRSAQPHPLSPVTTVSQRVARCCSTLSAHQTDYMDVPAAPGREELQTAVCSAALRVPWTWPQQWPPTISSVPSGSWLESPTAAVLRYTNLRKCPITATVHRGTSLLQARALPPQGLDPRSRPQGRTKRSSQEGLKMQSFTSAQILHVAHEEATPPVPVNAKNPQGISHRLQSHQPAYAKKMQAVTSKSAIKGAKRLRAPHKC